MNLLIDHYTFKFNKEDQEELKENLAFVLWNCTKIGKLKPHCTINNNTNITVSSNEDQIADDKDLMKKVRLINTFFIRIVDLKLEFSQKNEQVTIITMTLLNNTIPINGSKVDGFLSQISQGLISTRLKHRVYRGRTYSEKQPDPGEIKMRWIVIGFSALGGLLTVFLVCLICRCTTRQPYPPPFQKVRRDSKDFEMESSNLTYNPRLMAFANPYYDIIAAMGLDEDVEEDYYNPLYDNVELHSDTETEPEDMYYSFRNNNYHSGSQYPYDKDSGFSSGTLM